LSSSVSSADCQIQLCSATILYRPDQPYADVKALARRISERAISLEGTASGEHGVVRNLIGERQMSSLTDTIIKGQSKIEFMERELGHETVELMRMIKNTLDPRGLFKYVNRAS
jgi:D-lactate dehydrogenase (cytochrome)